jgi:hypothetical protein
MLHSNSQRYQHGTFFAKAPFPRHLPACKWLQPWLLYVEWDRIQALALIQLLLLFPQTKEAKDQS